MKMVRDLQTCISSPAYLLNPEQPLGDRVQGFRGLMLPDAYPSPHTPHQ